MKDKGIEKLQTQINCLETILNSVETYIFTKDLSGRYTYVNALVAELFQAQAEDIIGKDDSYFFDLTVSDQLRQNDLKVMNEGVVVEAEEKNVIKATGEIKTYKSIKKPLFNEKNEIIGICGFATDISEQKELEVKVKEHKQLLDVVLNNVDAYIYMKDSERNFLYVNSKVADLFGLPAEDISGKLDSEVLEKDVADHFWQSDKKVFETNQKQTIEENMADKNGKQKHYISTKIPYQFADNREVLIGFSTDVTELYQLKENFQKQASTDSLTGLYNRRYFLENAEREFHRAKRHQLPFSIITIDIDHFKEINDRFGHPVGDQVLVCVVNNIMPNIRTEDIFARIGGEEFCVLLPNTLPEKARLVAHRMCQYQYDHPVTGEWGGHINVTISVGVTCMQASDNAFQELFSRSDKALYQAKRTGKNKVCFQL